MGKYHVLVGGWEEGKGRGGGGGGGGRGGGSKINQFLPSPDQAAKGYCEHAKDGLITKLQQVQV